MNKEVKLKRIKVRQGMTGFHTRILESGDIAHIPADIPEIPKEQGGWFDDYPEEEKPVIGAAGVGRKAGVNENTSMASRIADPYSPDAGSTDSGQVPEGSPEQTEGNADANDQQDQNTDQGTDGEKAEAPETKSTKAPTKSDIIKELEALGVQDIDKNAKKEVLENQLELVKNALASQE